MFKFISTLLLKNIWTLLVLVAISYGPECEKTCLRGFVNRKGTDQLAHPGRLINTFVIRLLKSIISQLASSQISMF